jgi:hypothetical protein
MGCIAAASRKAVTPKELRVAIERAMAARSISGV